MRELFNSFKLFDIDPSQLRSKGFYKNFVVDEREKFWTARSALNKSHAENCCFLCGNRSGNQLFLEHDGYQLFECSHCSLIFANVKVQEEFTETIYDNSGYEEMIKKEVMETYDYRKNKFGGERLQYLKDHCQFNPQSHHLLDLGCGPGYFLKYLQERDISAMGIELTDHLVSICQSLDLNVHKLNLSELDDQQFDVITMFDVLEHLHQPINFFEQANRKLKANGNILMYTPNIHSFSFYFQKGKQNLLLPYEHLCFYDDKSLQYLAEQAGFEVSSVVFHGLDVVDYLAMKEYEDGIDYNKKLKEIIPYLQGLIDHANLANHMRIVFRKK